MKRLYLLYFLINLLFIYKYGRRVLHTRVWLLMVVYVLIVGAFFLLLKRYKAVLNEKSVFGKLFILLSVIFIILFFVIIHHVNGNALNVDRWSAMDVAIKALLNGEYPYTAVDHLGGRTSNFPGLLLIGLPFYLLGSVAYLQIFSFGLLACLIYKFFMSNYDRFFLLSMFLLSPAYFWEVVAKSDLMSNIILLLFFILFWKKLYGSDIFRNPYLLGLLVGLLFLTRGIVVLPLIIFMVKPFFADFKETNIFFIVSFLIIISILIFPIVLTMPPWDVVRENNPLSLQTSYLPSYVYIILIVLSFIFSFKIKTLKHLLLSSFFVILLSSLFSFFFFLKHFSFHQLVLNSKFDISYFSMSLPFLIFSIGLMDSSDKDTIL